MSVDTDAITQRLKNATPGPWAVKPGTYAVHSPQFECWIPQDINDAKFVAAAPGDIAELLAEVARLREALKPFAKAIDWYGSLGAGHDDNVIAPDGLPITLGDLRRARGVLEP